MAFDSGFLDILRQRVSLLAHIGRRHKLIRSGRNWKVCCPFHGEKTPSFHIYDDDHYHCYGCQAHGDVITYVMQSENCNFIEAVERLAAEAGLEVPKISDPQAEARRERAKNISDLLAYVQKRYRRHLYQDEGRAGLAYLQKRGLKEETLERFGLGWAGNERSLLEDLKSEGFSLEQCRSSGLFRLDERGEIKGGLFFNRVMFPIKNQKGEIISFGGRILGDGQPKYVNGPETEIFSKKRTLFNFDLAREAVRQGASLLVVEGYMDVIALDQAGIRGAVAPLGTAIGEEQLALLWRAAPAPIFCLDGDKAGIRASLRSCELALPFLTEKKTLRFCHLEAGDDPDSFVQREGRAAMERLIASARPLVEELFLLLTQGEENPGPEKRASLRKQLVSLAASIEDKTLSSEYRSSLLDFFFQRYRKVPPYKERGRGGRERGFSSQSHIGGFQGTAHQVIEADEERLKILLSLLYDHPALFPEVEHAYMQLLLPAELEEVRTLFLEWAEQTESFEREALRAWLREKDAEILCKKRISTPLRPVFDMREGRNSLEIEEVLEIWWHFYGLMNFAHFEAEIQKEVQNEILKAYERPLSSEAQKNGESETLRFPERLSAKMRVLEALRRGEKIDLEENL